MPNSFISCSFANTSIIFPFFPELSVVYYSQVLRGSIEARITDDILYFITFVIVLSEGL